MRSTPEQEKIINEGTEAGLSIEEIAELAGVSIGTVKRRRRAARAEEDAKEDTAPIDLENLPTTELDAVEETKRHLAIALRSFASDLRTIGEISKADKLTTINAKNLIMAKAIAVDKLIVVSNEIVRLDRAHGSRKPVKARYSRKVVQLVDVTKNSKEDGEKTGS